MLCVIGSVRSETFGQSHCSAAADKKVAFPIFSCSSYLLLTTCFWWLNTSLKVCKVSGSKPVWTHLKPSSSIPFRRWDEKETRLNKQSKCQQTRFDKGQAVTHLSRTLNRTHTSRSSETRDIYLDPRELTPSTFHRCQIIRQKIITIIIRMIKAVFTICPCHLELQSLSGCRHDSFNMQYSHRWS